MRRILIIVAVVAGTGVAWIALGRQLVLLVDNFATTGEAAATSGPFTYGPGWLNVGQTPLELAGPYGRPSDLISVDGNGRVTLHADGKDFALGGNAAEAQGAGPYDMTFSPDPGDMVTFRMAHSVFGWPVPLEMNFMTGNSPSWKRNVYYTIHWRKADGASAELTWRYEQWLYDHWASPQMTREGATGLISVRISEK